MTVIRPQQGLAGDTPTPAAQAPGLGDDALNFWKGQLSRLFSGVRRNAEPTMTAAVIATVGQIETTFQGKSRDLGKEFAVLAGNCDSPDKPMAGLP